MAEPQALDGLLHWRCIGPFRGGRVVAVCGSYDDPNTFYFGGVGGGVWKTIDGGTYWRNVTDGYFGTSAVGAVAVAPSDSNVIYAGTGETTIRIDVSHGDGVYKSTDAGRSWKHIGLSDSRFIGKIRVHPDNPDIVWVAAFGHAYGPNKERGVYKSVDGGATWKQVLFVSDRAGAVDLSVDPANPRILYAAIWEAYRNFWQISSGGPDSGLWQSTDGGETWADITDRPGLPSGIKGKIGVAVSPAKPGRVWALIEHTDKGGLYRSDDLGATWERVSDNQNLVSRAWYYIHLTADPQDGETVFVNNLDFWKSTDGGKTFFEIATPHGDNHDLWIDPKNNQRMIQGNDGGACVSFNGGFTFSTIYNQPTAQFYHLATDSRDPYYVYGTQQDNSSVAVPSRTNHRGITWGDCFIAGTGESGYIAVRPDNPNIVYVGAIGSSPGGGNALQRYDHVSQQIRLVTTWPETMSGYGASEEKHRFAWTYPIVISPHDPNTLYIGGHMVFKSTDEGQSWQAISPDLTRHDPETLKATGGPVNLDAIGAETYATVFSLAESPHEQGVLWAGSDDGLVHISRDGGANWQNVTPPQFSDWTLVSGIEPSPFDPGTTYIAATRYKNDDFQPYLFVTRDYGQHWTRINGGIPDNDFTRVIRADPACKGLLYAGTETGLYVSFDDGTNWQRIPANFPVSPVYEILVRGPELVVGTHGRSMWILDDLTPLRQLAAKRPTGPAYLVPPRETVRVLAGVDFDDSPKASTNYIGTRGGGYLFSRTPDGETVMTFLDVGENPAHGVAVSYWLAEAPKEPISLTFHNAKGEEVRSFTSRKEDDPAIAKELRVPAAAGWNRFVWDMHWAPVTKIEGNDPPAEKPIDGPVVAPGQYTVTLKAGGQELTEQFQLVKPGNIKASQADLDAQADLLLRIYRLLDKMTTSINQMRDLRGQLDGWAKRLKEREGGDKLATAAEELRAKVLEIESAFVVPDLRPGWADNLNKGTRLLEKLTELTPVVALGDYKPTDAAEEVFADLSQRINDVLARFDKLVKDDLAAFNAQAAGANVGAVGVA